MAVTKENLDQMTEELKECKGDPTSTPSGLNSSFNLKPHQLTALEWMMKKEQQSTKGGILADDMGLGKTLELIALILKEKEEEEEEKEVRLTLIVCPLSLMKQWQKEISKFTKRRTISCFIYYGRNLLNGDNEDLENLYDVIITNYDTLSRSTKGKSPLFDIKWKRIILDEAHTVRNPRTAVAEAVCELRANFKWLVTGTPISNSLLDLHSLYKVLKLSEFDNKEFWEKKFGCGTDLNDQLFLHALLRATMLRRTKKDLQIELGLPEKREIIVRIPLDPEEERLYRLILERVKADTTKSQKGYGVILLRRQAVTHPNLLRTEDSGTINRADIDEPSYDSDEESEPGDDDELTDWWISERNKFVGELLRLVDNDGIFAKDRNPSKLRKLFELLENVLIKGDKAVVVSQWTKVIDLIHNSLKKRGISCLAVTGATKLEDRTKRCLSFNDPQSETKVLLLQMQVGGCGLNLTGGNHLFVYDLHWNPQLLKQVYDRIYRIGQEKPVFIYTLVSETEDSIEDYILETQNRKLELSERALSFNQVTPDEGWVLNDAVVKEAHQLTKTEYETLAGLKGLKG